MPPAGIKQLEVVECICLGKTGIEGIRLVNESRGV